MQPDQPTPADDRERLRRLAYGAISANLDAPAADRHAAADEIAGAVAAEAVERADEMARLLDIVRAKDREIEQLHGLLAQAEQHARDTQDELLPEAADEAYQRGLAKAVEVVRRQANLPDLVHFDRPSDFRKGVLTCLAALEAPAQQPKPTKD